MGTLTDAQRKWLEGLGIDTAVATTAMPAPPTASPQPPPPGGEYSLLNMRAEKKPNLDLNSPEMKAVLMKGLAEQAEIDRKEAEQKLQRIDKALADIKAYVAAMPRDELQKASYAIVMTEVRRRFPEAAGMSQWVRQTALKVPSLKGRLPSPKALMQVVETTVKARGVEMGWSLSTGKDMRTVNTDRLLAAYMSELPAGVTVDIGGGVVQLTLDGAALAVKTPAGEVDATAGKGGVSVALKKGDFGIQVANEGWKEFDPELRSRWKHIDGEARTVLALKAKRDKVRLELEQKRKGGAEVTADLTADSEKREAEFSLAWKKLQEQITVTAQASEKKLVASVAYLRKGKDDPASVKAGVDADVDLKEMQASVKAYFANPTVEAVLKVTAAADKVAARLELTAVKSGVVVTARFEQALDETKAAIEVMLREGKTKVAAELKKKADDLTAKLKLVHETKDLKLAAELEKTLKDVRGSIEVEYTKGQTTVKGGVSGSSTGEVGGKVQIDIALREGRSFIGAGDKLSFAANVSNSGYKFEVAFSMGEPVETASLQELFADADRQIRELYRLAGDQGVRSIEDATVLNAKLQEVMAPIKASAKKAKTLKAKSDISASFGFSVEGDWPAGGKAAAPAGMFSVKIAF